MEFGLKVFLFVLKTSVIINKYQSMAFRQNDWHGIFERMLLHYYNPKYINNVVFESRFFNRTTKAIYCQFELLEEPTDNDIEARLDSYKLYSNEYRGFPIKVNVDICKELERGSFDISAIKKYSNVTNCPWKKGFYVVKDYVPDESKFPPFIPHGRYKAILQIRYHSELVFEGHIYSEIKGVKKFGNTTVYV